MALNTEELALLDETGQVEIETSTADGTRRTTIWIVVVDGVVYVRSVTGESGNWYQRALETPEVAIEAGSERFEFRAIHVDDADQISEVSEALREKYPPGGPLDRMTRDEVLGTTLRLEPKS